MGHQGWRDQAHTTVVWVGAGDGRCSDPAPYTSFAACLGHDAAHELARQSRCDGDPEGYTTEQSRLIADTNLASQMAQDGIPEFWVSVYYVAVRMGGWWSWHFAGDCE